MIQFIGQPYVRIFGTKQAWDKIAANKNRLKVLGKAETKSMGVFA